MAPKRKKDAGNVTPDLSAGYIGPGMETRGSLSLKEPLELDGVFKGQLSVEDALCVGPEGRVDGDIEADAVELAGTVVGTLRVKGIVRVRDGAVLDAPLRAGGLVADPGARVRGPFRTHEEDGADDDAPGRRS